MSRPYILLTAARVLSYSRLACSRRATSLRLRPQTAGLRPRLVCIRRSSPSALLTTARALSHSRLACLRRAASLRLRPQTAGLRPRLVCIRRSSPSALLTTARALSHSRLAPSATAHCLPLRKKCRSGPLARRLFFRLRGALCACSRALGAICHIQYTSPKYPAAPGCPAPRRSCRSHTWRRSAGRGCYR